LIAMLLGVYANEAPGGMLDQDGEAVLRLIPEERESCGDLVDPERVELLIARQGAANRLLKIFPNVRWLQLLNAGYEKVDLDLLRERGILFTNARSVYCDTIAEDVLTKMLILSRNYATHMANQRNHFWPTDRQLGNLNIDLAGKTLGILGAGFIGRSIAVRARAFGLRVEGYDPYLQSQEGFDDITHDLYGLLNRADFVVASLPVTRETRDIIDERALSHMKPGAFFLNVARGEVVDEDALCRALNDGMIRGAAIDVARLEPLPADSPLWMAANLLVTPHRAAYGDQMEARICALVRRNIHHYNAGEPLEDQVRL